VDVRILFSHVCDDRHAAIREDISVNLTALETLHARHTPELLLIGIFFLYVFQ
jgi:hypothetical protein